MSIAEGYVGPQLGTDGNTVRYRATKDGSQGTQDTHGRYTEAVYRGNVYVATSQALATLQTGLTTAQTGLGIYNPAGSGKNLVIMQAACSFSVASANGLAVGICAATNVLQAAPTSQTLATYRNCLLGSGNAPAGIPLIAGTLAAAPVATNILGTLNTGAITTQTQLQPLQREFAGSLIVIPGAYLGFFSSLAAAATSFWGELMWEEIAI